MNKQLQNKISEQIAQNIKSYKDTSRFPGIIKKMIWKYSWHPGTQINERLCNLTSGHLKRIIDTINEEHPDGVGGYGVEPEWKWCIALNEEMIRRN